LLTFINEKVINLMIFINNTKFLKLEASRMCECYV